MSNQVNRSFFSSILVMTDGRHFTAHGQADSYELVKARVVTSASPVTDHKGEARFASLVICHGLFTYCYSGDREISEVLDYPL